MQWSLRHLRYLLAAAEQGSIARAAGQLGVSQAAVGAAINNLEDAFRVRVFVRQPGRGLSLTPLGRDLVLRAKALVHEAETFEAHAAQLSQHLSGPINVACFFPAASFVMPRLIATMAAQYPAISISLFEGDVYEVFQKLSDGSADIGLTYDLLVNERVVFEPLLSVPLYVLLPADSPLAQAGDVSLFDLARQPYIMLDLPGSREWFLQVFRRYGLEPRIRFRTRSTDMVRSLVANGQGFSLLGFRAPAERSHEGVELRYLPIREDLPTARFGLAYADQSRKTRAVEAFAGLARALLGVLRRELEQAAGQPPPAGRS
ncbi:LysR family transcriptional regulator [Aquibium sp. A9E412]|uniref:LysR family transcriptional regulator n=1 Tax=Aquibium sp. A9E412 TaxID=2976767 RepID=UPI0025AF6611|nr:LysR family transcriptional regulator [Aquibium sp. A9E412]MDN2566128.1 LysR family transcriptional regulator [Aquibium sp. A9E412]